MANKSKTGGRTLPELTIKWPSSLLGVKRMEITEAQARLVEKVVRVTDLTGDPERMEYDMDLALEELAKEG